MVKRGSVLPLLAALLSSTALDGLAAAPLKKASFGEEQQAAAWWLEVDGRVLTAGNERKKLAPASLTKMMTVLLALESAHLEDAVKVSRQAEAETGHRLGLKAGEEFRVADFAAAAVMASANDAARALAEHVGGSEAAFVKRMNARAARLGMADTRFDNATGHDAPGHCSSARDLALLGKEVMRNPWYAALASRVELEICSRAGRCFKLENRNELIGRYAGAIGVKSGTSPKSGQSLVAMAERGGRRAVLVLLDARERWLQAETLLDSAFSSASVPEGAPAGAARR